MHYPFTEIIDYLAYYISEEIIDRKCLEKMKSIAKYFSFDTINTFGFESILDNVSAEADMSFSILNEKIAAFINENETRKFCNENLYWNNFKKLSEYILENRNLTNIIKDIWLEFDVFKINDNLPVPAFFLKLNKNNNIKLIINYILKILKGSDLSENLTANLDNCLNFMDKSFFLEFIGYMPSRDPDAMRICINGSDINLLFDFLNRINIKFINDFEKSIRYYYKFVDFFVIDLDVGNKISDKIGIEFKMNDYYAKDQNRWIFFLDDLKNKNFCLTDKFNFFKKWKGRTREIFHRDLYRYLIHRILFYVKGVFLPGKRIEFKAYYGFAKELINN